MTLNNLETQIKIELEKLKGDTALVVKFLDSREAICVNETAQFWAASVIKIPIACEYFKQVKEGKLNPDNRIKVKLENRVQGSGIIKLLNKEIEFTISDLVIFMLDISDNSCTNEVVDLIGWENVEKYMYELGLKKTTFRHKMMITAGRGPNFTTAEDIALLLELLHKNLVPEAQQLVNILKEQQDRRRIALLIPNDIAVASKSGSLEKAVHDVGIIYSKKPFIFAFLSDDQEDKILTSQVLSCCCKFCFDYSMS